MLLPPQVPSGLTRCPRAATRNKQKDAKIDCFMLGFWDDENVLTPCGFLVYILNKGSMPKRRYYALKVVFVPISDGDRLPVCEVSNGSADGKNCHLETPFTMLNGSKLLPSPGIETVQYEVARQRCNAIKLSVTNLEEKSSPGQSDTDRSVVPYVSDE